MKREDCGHYRRPMLDQGNARALPKPFFEEGNQ